MEVILPIKAAFLLLSHEIISNYLRESKREWSRLSVVRAGVATESMARLSSGPRAETHMERDLSDPRSSRPEIAPLIQGDGDIVQHCGTRHNSQFTMPFANRVYHEKNPGKRIRRRNENEIRVQTHNCVVGDAGAGDGAVRVVRQCRPPARVEGADVAGFAARRREG